MVSRRYLVPALISRAAQNTQDAIIRRPALVALFAAGLVAGAFDKQQKNN